MWESSCFVWAGRRRDMTKLVVAFRTFLDAHKNVETERVNRHDL
jgi:hypothetical protein